MFKIPTRFRRPVKPPTFEQQMVNRYGYNSSTNPNQVQTPSVMVIPTIESGGERNPQFVQAPARTEVFQGRRVYYY